jgi:hypothetical protein
MEHLLLAAAGTAVPQAMNGGIGPFRRIEKYLGDGFYAEGRVDGEEGGTDR